MSLNIIHNIIGLFYPQVCAACGNLLLKDEETVCMTCRYILPKTNYEMNSENPLAQRFYGLVPFKAVTAEYFFSKTGKVQALVHELKYKGNRDAGLFLGRELGKSLGESPLFQDIDCIIPIPLHPKKEQRRGYNQSYVIALGIKEYLNKPIINDCLCRKVFTETQTHKSREERMKNVSGVFDLKNKNLLAGKHVLLIDDVLTTGSTLISAGKALLTIPDIKISAATAACANG